MSGLAAAIVVVGTNDGRWLDSCFRSLESSTRPGDHLLVFVDNASEDGSVETMRRDFPDVEVLRNDSNLGFARANNQGMRLARRRGARHIILVNPDTRCPPLLIDQLVQFLDLHPEYGIVGPLQCEYGGSGVDRPNAWTRHAYENAERHVFHHWEPDLPSESSPAAGRAPKTFEHAYVQGAAMAVRGKVLDKVGLFEERYHTFYEEVDLCRRVRWAGYRVALLNDVWIEHAGGAGGTPSLYRSFYMTRNRYLYLFTDPGIPWRTVLRLIRNWVWNDLHVQLPAPTGLVASRWQYLRIWTSLALLAPALVRLRRANHSLAAQRGSTRSRNSAPPHA